MTQAIRVIVDDAVIGLENIFQIIRPMWGVDIYQGEQIYRQGLAGFNENQQCVFAMQWYVTEVNNGGHRQFFSNSTGIV